MRNRSNASRVVMLLGLAFVGFTQPTIGAGFTTIEVPAAGDAAAIGVMLWSPCKDTPVTETLGPYQITGSRDCAIDGSNLPLVVISHGQGGSALGHHDTAVALADAGFVVASFNHPGDSFGDDSANDELHVFETRPQDVSRVISYLLSDWSGRALLDPSSVGVFGFSRGGYTALALAGAKPSPAAAAERFCGAWWSFVVSLCRQLGSDDARLDPQPDPRVRAIVVVDPLSLFDSAGLRSVSIPVQLWASELGGDGVSLSHVEAIRAALAPAPEYRVAEGAGHFAYLAPCSPAFKDDAPEICEDPEGFDRERWHRTMNEAVVAFFGRHLRATQQPPAVSDPPPAPPAR